MRIIITGATGSAGGYLTRYFHSRGHEVIATGKTADPPKQLLSYARYIQADINKPYLLPEADICIHTAALSDDKAKLDDLMKANVTGTRNTVEAAKECNKFIHISSSSVYLPSEIPLKEEIAGKQNNKQLSPYGFSKLMAEEMLIQTTRHLSCFILRPRAHYGIGDKMIIPRLLNLEKNNTLLCPGSMQVNVSMTHFENLARAVELCISSEKSGINLYNVADGQSYVFFDVIKTLTSRLYGQELPEKHIPVFLLKAMAFFKIGGMTTLLIRSFTKNMVLDISKIKKELGYNPEKEFYSSIDEIIAWLNNIGGIEVIKNADKSLAWKI